MNIGIDSTQSQESKPRANVNVQDGKIIALGSVSSLPAEQ